MHNVILDEGQKKDPTAILDALGEYFKLAKNVIYERYKFGCCKQETDEPINSFLTRLWERAASCEYRGLKDEMIWVIQRRQYHTSEQAHSVDKQHGDYSKTR